MVLTISFQVTVSVSPWFFCFPTRERKKSGPNLDNGGDGPLCSLSLSKYTINFTRLFFSRRRDTKRKYHLMILHGFENPNYATLIATHWHFQWNKQNIHFPKHLLFEAFASVEVWIWYIHFNLMVFFCARFNNFSPPLIDSTKWRSNSKDIGCFDFKNPFSKKKSHSTTLNLIH